MTFHPNSHRTHHTPEAPAAARVLVVDDDDSIRRLTERILTRSGYVVATARSGNEALEVCRASAAFDLLLTDIVMPDIDGESVAQRVRAMQRRVVVLFMSGYGDGPDLAYEDGATLGKPFTQERLLRSVAETLGRGTEPRSALGLP